MCVSRLNLYLYDGKVHNASLSLNSDGTRRISLNNDGNVQESIENQISASQIKESNYRALSNSNL